MPPLQAAILIARELRQRTDTAALEGLYPEEGPLRRELYPKHIEAFAAGKDHSERCVLGGNRTGKTLGIGGYETALHLTGLYPEWWPGRTYEAPILAWTAGTKAVKVRDTNQSILLGDITRTGGITQAKGGLVPAARIRRITRKAGVADAIDQVIIAHKLGWENKLAYKSYEEGRQSFEAEEVDWIWLDEEKGLSRSIYDECRLRLLTAGGSILSTFTPVEGLTETVISMLEDTDLL